MIVLAYVTGERKNATAEQRPRDGCGDGPLALSIQASKQSKKILNKEETRIVRYVQYENVYAKAKQKRGAFQQ